MHRYIVFAVQLLKALIVSLGLTWHEHWTTVCLKWRLKSLYLLYLCLYLTLLLIRLLAEWRKRPMNQDLIC